MGCSIYCRRSAGPAMGPDVVPLQKEDFPESIIKSGQDKVYAGFSEFIPEGWIQILVGGNMMDILQLADIG